MTRKAVVCCDGWLVGVVLHDVTRGCCQSCVAGAGCVDVTSGVDDIVCVVDTVERDWLEAILR